MKDLFFYLVEVILVSGVLYGFYFFVLRNERFHQYNRFYLLGVFLFAVILPFFSIRIEYPSQANGMPMILDPFIHSSVVHPNFPASVPIVQAAQSGYSWQQIGILLYCIVLCVSGISLLSTALRLKMLVRRNGYTKIGAINFVNTTEPGTPFSFLNWLFWNTRIDLNTEEGEQIFQHELIHIRQRHSVDTILMEVLTAIFWMNPFFYIAKKECRTIHEFLADRYAAKEQRGTYAEMLLMNALHTKHKLVHPFFQVQLKRRIEMLLEPRHSTDQFARKLLVLPMGGLLFAFVTFRIDVPVTYNSRTKAMSVLNNGTNSQLQREEYTGRSFKRDNSQQILRKEHASSQYNQPAAANYFTSSNRAGVVTNIHPQEVHVTAPENLRKPSVFNYRDQAVLVSRSKGQIDPREIQNRKPETQVVLFNNDVSSVVMPPHAVSAPVLTVYPSRLFNELVIGANYTDADKNLYAQVEIFDQQGTLVQNDRLERKLLPGSQSISVFTINFSRLKKGVYIINLISSDQRIRQTYELVKDYGS